jgi:threonine/homoserine/homoserine lactone efflux protein
MMLLAFLGNVALISMSGVMAPGPLSAVTMDNGIRNPHAGAITALGHGIVEVPLMTAIFFGLGHFLRMPLMRMIVLPAGGLLLLVMGVQLLLAARSGVESDGSTGPRRRPLAAGAILTAGNPYFLVWWATVGAALISRSMELGAIVFPLLAITHWLCDLVWLYFLSIVAWRAGHRLGPAFARTVSLISGVVLLVFGERFLIEGLVMAL